MIESTNEHMHFAGYKFGRAPQLHLTYLMWKRGVGFRVGTTRVYTDNKRKPTLGLRHSGVQRVRRRRVGRLDP